MKFTKVIVLALALIMVVSSFAACGNDTPDVTTPEVTTPEVTTPEVTTPEVTTPEPCEHKRTRNLGDPVLPTCITPGSQRVICTNCREEFDVVLEATGEHVDVLTLSVDGKYVKKVCATCQRIEFAEVATGNVVADGSAIKFPFFYTGADVDDMANLTEGNADIVLGDTQFAQVLADTDGNKCINVPSGFAKDTSNGFFVLNDVNGKFAGKSFGVQFKVKFSEYPSEKASLLTWTVGDKSFDIVSAEKDALSVLGTKTSSCLTGKGWDAVKVEISAAGAISVYVNGTLVGTGSAGTLSGASSFKFFEAVSHYEAYIDDIALYLND